jgi:RimJ/RimL family protein N-acetyltransferase
MWIEYIKKAVNYFKNHGFISTVKRIRLELFIYRKAIMYNKQLVPPNPDFTDNLNINIASKEDIDEEYAHGWHTKKCDLEKLSKGHILFLAKDRGTNIFYGWVELLNIEIPWLSIKKKRIPANIGYLSGFYVPPEHRGQHIMQQSLKFIENYLVNHTKVDRVFCVTAPDNYTSNKNLSISGYTPYWYIRYLKLMFLNVYIVELLQEKNSKTKKIFVQNSNFGNAFSVILGRT